MDFKEYWNEIHVKTTELRDVISAYWNDYSHLGTWQFWVILILFLLPLVIIFFAVDRKRIFEVFFFGYTVHLLWTYASIMLEGQNFMIHTYFLTPALPFSLNLTSSFLPVGFLLLYQYATEHKKNFYLYSILLSSLFAFIFAAVEEELGFLVLNKGMNNFHLFLIDLTVVFISYWFTLFIKKLNDNNVKMKK